MVPLMGLYSQYSVRFEKGKRVCESTELHPDTLALVGLSLEALSLSRSLLGLMGKSLRLYVAGMLGLTTEN